MSAGVAILLYCVILAVLLAGGIWIGVALGIIGILGLYIQSGSLIFTNMGSVIWNSGNSFLLVAVPLFIFMGEIILMVGIGDRLYHGLSLWLNRIPGNLLHANIAACSIFAATSGSSVACAAAVGTVAIPELRRRGYDRYLIYGSLAAGGTLGILIPPSIAMILYGNLFSQSVPKLFMAGVIPGLVMAALFSLYILIVSVMRKGSAPQEMERISWGDRLKSLPSMLPVLGLVAIILGGIYFGIMTPTEAAAIGCVYVLAWGFITKTIKWQSLRQALTATIKTTCMVMLIIIGAQLLSWSLANSGITQGITAWVVGLGLSSIAFNAALLVIYLILGMFLDGVSMMYLTLPIFYPILLAYHFDLIWFGIVFTLFTEMGLITPPVGMNLFVIQGVSHEPLGEISKAALPFVLIMVLMWALLLIFPQLALWLPYSMGTR